MRSWRFLKDFSIRANRISFAKVHTFVQHFFKSQNEKRSKCPLSNQDAFETSGITIDSVLTLICDGIS
jgi:hypothetical protein